MTPADSRVGSREPTHHRPALCRPPRLFRSLSRVTPLTPRCDSVPVTRGVRATDPAKPFDFLVDGELVRTSLEKLLIRKGISAESVLEVEYIPAVSPPSDEATGQHEDWVSAVDGSWAGAVATGCYDGTARLWTPGGCLMATLAGAKGAVTAVGLLPPPSGGMFDDGSTTTGATVVAGGHDGMVRTWDVAVRQGKKDGKGADAKEAVGSRRVFVGHGGAVNAVAASPGGEFFASASHDCTARVWSRLGGAVDAGSKKSGVKKGKRRKGEDGAARADEDVTDPAAALGEETRLEGHKDSVSAVAWESADTVWTGSFDHTLKCWNAETAQLQQSFDTPKAVSAVAVKAGGGRVAWCGGGDRAVHMWDPRVGQTTGATTSLASHTVCPVMT